MERKALPFLLVIILLIFTISSVSAFAPTAKLVQDLWGGASGSQPANMIAFDGKLIFSANDGASGVELWQYDGATISQVGDINAGAGSSNPDDFKLKLSGISSTSDLTWDAFEKEGGEKPTEGSEDSIEIERF